jgi:hypothetical protein
VNAMPDAITETVSGDQMSHRFAAIPMDRLLKTRSFLSQNADP